MSTFLFRYSTPFQGGVSCCVVPTKFSERLVYCTSILINIIRKVIHLVENLMTYPKKLIKCWIKHTLKQTYNSLSLTVSKQKWISLINEVFLSTNTNQVAYKGCKLKCIVDWGDWRDGEMENWDGRGVEWNVSRPKKTNLQWQIYVWRFSYGFRNYAWRILKVYG